MASALITHSRRPSGARAVGSFSAGSGCVPDGLSSSPSVDHAPSLGVQPNVQTGFAPKVEETLGYCRKPHMGTGAFRARKAAHLRLTPVGPLPSAHSVMRTWYAGQVRIAISADTIVVTTCLMWRQARWRSLCDYPSRQSVKEERRAAATSARGLKTTSAVRRHVPGVPAIPVYSRQGEACGSSFRGQCAPTWFRGVVDAEWSFGWFHPRQSRTQTIGDHHATGRSRCYSCSEHAVSAHPVTGAGCCSSIHSAAAQLRKMDCRR